MDNRRAHVIRGTVSPDMDPDPLRYGIRLDLETVYYPLGFPLTLATNSEHVLRAAARSWSEFSPLFRTPPLALRVAVDGQGTRPAAPVYRGQAHLMTIASDSDNFAVCDYTRRFGFCRLNETAAADAVFIGYYFLEAMAYHLLTQLHVTPVHGASVARGRRGLLLCGAAGAGKTTLAYAAARAGWTYVSDNESWLVRGRRAQVVGNPQRIRFRESGAALFPELEGLPAARDINGKMSIDLSTASLARFATAGRCAVHAVILLDRRRDGPDSLEPAPQNTAAGTLLAGVPMYEPHIHRQHVASLERLLERPAFVMRYRNTASALGMLEEVVRAR